MAFAEGVKGIPAFAWGATASTALLGGITDVMMRLAVRDPKTGLPAPAIELRALPIAGVLFVALMAGGGGFMLALLPEKPLSSPAIILAIFFSALGGSKTIQALQTRFKALLGKLAA